MDTAAATEPVRTLQEGIYHDCSDCTGPFFSVAFLRAAQDASISDVAGALAGVWDTCQRLRVGELRDLPGHPVPAGDLQVLLAYGRSLFLRGDVGRTVPEQLERFDFDVRDPVAGAAVLDNAGLSYADDLGDNAARCDVAVQLTATTQLAAHRGVVEIWKHLQDLGGESAAPLWFSGIFSGFLRDDRRSWIDFHDGVNNLRRGRERGQAITIKPGPAVPAWTVGGTYLAFMRIVVNLGQWRAIPTPDQELLVGRSKLTGAPLIDIDSGVGVPVPGCPVAGTVSVVEPGNEAFRDPPVLSQPALLGSHVQRANHHVPNPADSSSSRIFRQGYEFLETLQHPPFFRAGLNFVSFQDTPQRLHRVLTTDGWLGGTNFGGDPESPIGKSASLLSVRAAGLFLAPPVTADESFPGAAIVGLR